MGDVRQWICIEPYKQKEKDKAKESTCVCAQCGFQLNSTSIVDFALNYYVSFFVIPVIPTKSTTRIQSKYTENEILGMVVRCLQNRFGLCVVIASKGSWSFGAQDLKGLAFLGWGFLECRDAWSGTQKLAWDMVSWVTTQRLSQPASHPAGWPDNRPDTIFLRPENSLSQ